MAGRGGRRVVQGSFFVHREILSGRKQCAAAQAAGQAAADDLCGRGIAGGEGFDRGESGCVFDAWRFAGTRGGESAGSECAAGEIQGRTVKIWNCGKRDGGRKGKGTEGGVGG